LLPQQPEAAGLLALLLTDARRAARLDTAGDVVPLPDQDRSRWDRDKIREGRALLAPAARAARPGPYQLHAAIAACHSRATETDWRQVAALYGELARYEPTAVVEANRGGGRHGRGPGGRAGHPRSARAQAGELAAVPHRARRPAAPGRPGCRARGAYRAALRLALPRPERAFIERRLREL
jgi:RNA polymerase sigma-70 factor (ECF subfamily)